MKFVLPVLCMLLIQPLQSQVLKRMGQRVKEDVKWHAERKANQKIDEGLDSLIAAPKKAKDKKKAKKQTETTAAKRPAGADAADGAANEADGGSSDDADMTAKDGYIRFELSMDEIFPDGAVTITGESARYDKYKTVEMTVTGPTPTDVRQISLDNDGKFSVAWAASGKTGKYTVTISSSDRKASTKRTFSVVEMDVLYADDWPDENRRELKEALDRLDDAADLVKGELSPGQKKQTDEKLDKLKKDAAEIDKLFVDLGKAGHDVAKLYEGRPLPKNLRYHLTALNENLHEQALQMKKLNAIADHKPQDNTICEYLVMLNEACAAFSTFTNVWSKSVLTIVKNITIDKAIPAGVGVVNDKTVRVPAPLDYFPKQIAKIFATAEIDAASVASRGQNIGMAGDLVQFASDVLLRNYCEIYSGTLTHQYSINFRSDGDTWWKYGVRMDAVITLRNPKNQKGIVKLKGNIEGNATKFSFFADVSKNAEFNQGSGGKFKIQVIKDLVPGSIPFSSAERDYMGFGAIARGLATPAYFNVPIDAEYDTDRKTMKFFVNSALVDFTEFVQNHQLFVMWGPDGLPRIKYMSYPIHPARATLNSVFISGENNQFAVSGAGSKASITGERKRHIGDAAGPRETDLSLKLNLNRQ